MAHGRAITVPSLWCAGARGTSSESTWPAVYWCYWALATARGSWTVFLPSIFSPISPSSVGGSPAGTLKANSSTDFCTPVSRAVIRSPGLNWSWPPDDLVARAQRRFFASLKSTSCLPSYQRYPAPSRFQITRSLLPSYAGTTCANLLSRCHNRFVC